ncbi:MAG: sigma-54-dependent Fis family transcriptional regulator [Pedosphaera sp.]|nr:sigma-54-dependent Fis family transcriptional regulator [Pedosphaera sp.]
MTKPDLSGLSILILEDEVLLRKQIHSCLEKLGADVTSVESVERARKLAHDLSFDFALLDVNLPDGLGTDLLKEKAFSAATGVIIMTAQGGVDGAVEAMRLGALDYLAKPFDPLELPLVMSRARRTKQSERLDEHQKSEAPRGADGFFFGAALAPLHAQLDKILAADQRMQSGLPPVLIHGETGTGKTTIARWLHGNGPRARQPLVEINCSALPETLAESELFGHERGAFTDARTARMGLFEAANGGTLFLDELPSLSLPLQAKVLTVIEDQKIRRVGGNREIPVDVRIIAATNRDLKATVAAGHFREDLFHRLDLYRVEITPLRERGEDILRLAEALMDRLAKRHRLPRKPIHAIGCQSLLSYRWPGNVRELSHELERAIVFEENEELKFDKLHAVAVQTLPMQPLPLNLAANLANTPVAAAPASDDWFQPNFTFPQEGFALEEAINRLIHHALKQTGSNVSAAARLLGVSRDYVRYRLAGQKQPLELGKDSPES